MRRISPAGWARAALAVLPALVACASSSSTSPNVTDDASVQEPPDEVLGADASNSTEPDTELDGASREDASGAEADTGMDASLVDASAIDDAPATDAVSVVQEASSEEAGADAAQAAPCIPFVQPNDCTVPSGGVLPTDLRCTGLYGDFNTRQLACDIDAYKPAFELWSDGAEKHRFISLPPNTKVDISDPDGFVFPVGTQLWKEFRVDAAGEKRPAETRLLRKTDSGWLYTTYVWSTDGQSAVQQNDGVHDLFGSGHTVPTRDQCRECHEGRRDFVLGWDLLLLGDGATGLTRERLAERDLLIGGDASALTQRVPGNMVEQSALGYLHANCGVSCHNENAQANAHETGLFLRLSANGLRDAREAPAVKTGVNKLPSIHAKLPFGGPYYDIRPGDVAHSLVHARMNVRGDETQMPRIGSHRVDAIGVDAVARWIEAMSVESGYPAAAPVEGGAVNTPDAPDAGTPDAGTPDAGTPIDSGTPLESSTPDADTSGPDAGPSTCSTATPPKTDNLAYEVIVRDTSLETLSFAAQAPESDDWYLVEMRGRIMRLHNGVLETAPFLDLTSAIDLGAGFDQTTVSYDERGLVGLAFAPDYPDSGLFYITITPSRSNALGLTVNHDMVLEYQRSATPGVGPSLRRTILKVPSSSAYLGNIHNANTVRFGPDGMLYVGMGDGGGVNCNDAEPNSAQNIGMVFGKILRFDPNQPAPYAALNNPFAGVGDARVFHYGVRNPFRFSFDRQTGDLFIGDVGQNRYEEIDYAPSGSKGLNFGWATYEANSNCPGPTRAFRPGAVHTTPIFVADRTGTGTFSDYRAIVGGVVYRGNAIPTLSGSYLFGDYYGRRLAALYRCGTQTSGVSVLRKGCDPNFPEPCLQAPAAAPAFGSLTAIVEDHAGEIYFVASGNSLLKLVAR